ncbi:hypothetical protein J8273_7583 [Carpediemonas membranifera]|uniref:Uncharacterized protein n=1 Tax=Carpediemonas membranifera TaxID=201153 RepID=A0A8J6E223_9EUKA|nr:hypothetical protein J8273_7583 [Carpediemonas membranifera]|eukprot:KAG9391342.1 hypothetical protein J8273_7583 [Carpediemonas membranifera]
MTAYAQEVINDSDFRPFSSFVFSHFWKAFGLDSLTETHLQQFLDVIDLHRETSVAAALFASFLYARYTTADLLYFLFLRSKLSDICPVAHMPCHRVDMARARLLPVPVLEFPTSRPAVTTLLAPMPASFRDTLDDLIAPLWTDVVDADPDAPTPLVSHPGTVHLPYASHNLRKKPRRIPLIAFLAACTESFHLQDHSSSVTSPEELQNLCTVEFVQVNRTLPLAIEEALAQPHDEHGPPSPPFKGKAWETFQNRLRRPPASQMMKGRFTQSDLLKDLQVISRDDPEATLTHSNSRVRFAGTVEELQYAGAGATVQANDDSTDSESEQNNDMAQIASIPASSGRRERMGGHKAKPSRPAHHALGYESPPAPTIPPPSPPNLESIAPMEEEDLTYAQYVDNDPTAVGLDQIVLGQRLRSRMDTPAVSFDPSILGSILSGRG